MKKYFYFIGWLLIATFLMNPAIAQNILEWHSTTGGDAVTLVSDYTIPDLEASSLKRGSGLIVAASYSRSFNARFAPTPDKAAAIANNMYYEFSITTKPQKKVSLSAIDIKLFRNADSNNAGIYGPNAYQWAYKIGTGGIQWVKDAISFTTINPNGGEQQPSLDLSGISALQSFSGTVTFYLYAWGGTAPVSMGLSGLPIGKSSAGEPLMSIKGTIEGVLLLSEEILGKDFLLLSSSSTSSTYSGKSADFMIKKDFINFNIKGTYNPFRTCINLWYNNKIVRSSTGHDDNQNFKTCSWDVSEFKGKTVYLQVVDAEGESEKTIATSGFTQSDAPNATVEGNITTEIQKAKDLAAKSINENISKASMDINRPEYHFRPLSQRVNDPNGTFYANGYYHLFYQYNPLADYSGGGYMLWSHARSKDLVNWEYLPIAIWPDWEKGELQCYSGGAFKHPNGTMMLFYTSVPAPGLPRSQRIVVPVDEDFITWKQYTESAVMPYVVGSNPDPGFSWRDPFVFEDGGKTFALLTTKNGVDIYQALNNELTAWEFKNTIYNTSSGASECPNFFRFGNKWMLIISPQNPVEYAIGTFDPATAQFTVEGKGNLNSNNQYYATQGIVDDQGRQILLGLIKGFKNKMGWRDCMALPRVLTLATDGTPRQIPVPELETLRGTETNLSERVITQSRQVLEGISGDLIELAVELEPGKSKACGLRIRCSTDGTRSFEIRYEDNHLILPGSKIKSVALPLVNGTIKLRIFIDKGAIEVFSADGKLAETRVYYAEADDLGVELFAIEGEARLKRLQAWKLKPAEMNSTIVQNILEWRSTTSGDAATLTSDYIAPELETSLLKRGSGLIAAASYSRSFNARFAPTADKATAVANNMYYEFSITTKPQKKMSLSAIDIKLYRNEDSNDVTIHGPNAYQWAYKIEAGAIQWIGNPISFTTIDPSGGEQQPSLDLSGISALQNFSGTVTFYLYAWGGTAPVSMGLSGLPIGKSSTEEPLMSIKGTVVGALPIKLGSITGENENGAIRLRWVTVSETNNSHFLILHAASGEPNQAIGKVSGLGNSSAITNYSFTDYNPSPGFNYYKLRQVDADGTWEDSKVVAVSGGITEDKRLSVHIAENSLNVFFNSLHAGKYLLKITDVTGKELNHNVLLLSEGINTLAVPIQLQQGLYIARITDLTNNENITVKFIKS